MPVRRDRRNTARQECAGVVQHQQEVATFVPKRLARCELDVRRVLLVRKDLKLDVTVTRIDGEDDEPIYDAYTNRFSKRDQVRLDTLKSYQEEHVADSNAS